METFKPKESPEWVKDKAADYLEKIRNGGKLLISITHTSASNMSYRYSVRLAYWDGESAQVENLAYWLGCLWDEKVIDGWPDLQLRGRGVGTDRYFLAAYDIGQSLKSLGLLSDPHEIGTRKVYKEC